MTSHGIRRFDKSLIHVTRFNTLPTPLQHTISITEILIRMKFTRTLYVPIPRPLSLSSRKYFELAGVTVLSGIREHDDVMLVLVAESDWLR